MLRLGIERLRLEHLLSQTLLKLLIGDFHPNLLRGLVRNQTTLQQVHRTRRRVLLFALLPGNAFTIDQAPDSKARFSYSTLAPDQLSEAVARLGRALDTFDARR